MKILLLGASSYVGAGLYRELQKKHQISGTYANNKLFPELIRLDLTDNFELEKTIKTAQPDIVIHAANQANSRWCADNPEEAIKLNQTATKNIVEICNQINSRLIYISSTAASTPVNLYAQTKLGSEKIVQSSKNSWLILRPSLVLGYSPNTTNDRPFNRLIKNIIENKVGKYDNLWKFKPTDLNHLSQVILSAIDQSIWNKIISVTVPETTDRYQVARDILVPFGLTPTADKIDTTTPFMDAHELELKALGLPECCYQELISNAISELKAKLS